MIRGYRLILLLQFVLTSTIRNLTKLEVARPLYHVNTKPSHWPTLWRQYDLPNDSYLAYDPAKLAKLATTHPLHVLSLTSIAQHQRNVHWSIKNVGREPSWCRSNSEYHKLLASFYSQLREHVTNVRLVLSPLWHGTGNTHGFDLDSLSYWLGRAAADQTPTAPIDSGLRMQPQINARTPPLLSHSVVGALLSVRRNG